MAQHTTIHGYPIYYEDYDQVRYGLEHLYNATQGEFDTLIDAAKMDGTAEFHDPKYGQRFILKYDFSWSTHTLERSS